MTKVRIVNDGLPLTERYINSTVHTATSYQVSTSKDFDTEGNVVAESIQDTVNLRSWTTYVDGVNNSTPLYCRIEFYFIYQGVEYKTGWSRIVLFDGRQVGFKMSDFIVATPDVVLEVSEEDEYVDIQSRKFEMWAGAGDHKTSSYRIIDTDNVKLYELNDDDLSLLSYQKEDDLTPGKIYSLEVKHTNTTNNESNFGKRLYFKYSPDLNLTEFEAPEDLVINRKFYYRIKVYTIRFDTYDLEVRDAVGNVVLSVSKETTLARYLWIDDVNFTVYGTYSIYIRLNFTDGTSSIWTQVYSNILAVNQIVYNIPNTTYLNKYNESNDVFTDGIACTTIKETFDNKIIMTDFSSNDIYLYKAYNDEYRQIVKVIDLSSVSTDSTTVYSDIDYLGVYQISNHDLLIDAVMYDDKHQKTTMFIRYEYDPIRMTCTELNRLARDDERYSTAMNCSLVCGSGTTSEQVEVYYIPAMQVDNQVSGNERIKPKLRKLDPETMVIEAEYELPYNAIYNASLCIDMDNNIYFYGGSYEMLADADNDNEEYWKLNNRDIYLFNKSEGTFTKVATFPDEVPDELYTIHSFLRLDGKIVMFNATHSGPALNFSKFIIFDPSTYTITLEDSNVTNTVPYRNSIIFHNGNISRISSKTLDPQSVLTYISNTKYDTEVSADTIVDPDVEDLIVEDGQTVRIEDIYKYNSITIQGEGILEWYRAQGLTKLYSKDYIVKKTMSMTATEIREKEINSLLILDGCEFTVLSDEEDVGTSLYINYTTTKGSATTVDTTATYASYKYTFTSNAPVTYTISGIDNVSCTYNAEIVYDDSTKKTGYVLISDGVYTGDNTYSSGYTYTTFTVTFTATSDTDTKSVTTSTATLTLTAPTPDTGDEDEDTTEWEDWTLDFYLDVTDNLTVDLGVLTGGISIGSSEDTLTSLSVSISNTSTSFSLIFTQANKDMDYDHQEYYHIIADVDGTTRYIRFVINIWNSSYYGGGVTEEDIQFEYEVTYFEASSSLGFSLIINFTANGSVSFDYDLECLYTGNSYNMRYGGDVKTEEITYDNDEKTSGCLELGSYADIRTNNEYGKLYRLTLIATVTLNDISKEFTIDTFEVYLYD